MIFRCFSRKATYKTDPFYVDHTHIRQLKQAPGNVSSDADGHTIMLLVSGGEIKVWDSPNSIRRRICKHFKVDRIRDVPGCHLKETFNRKKREVKTAC